MERRRDRIHGDSCLIYDLIDLFRAHSGADRLGNCVQAGHIDLGALFDALNLFRSLDDTPVRSDMSLELKAFYLLVEAHMATLIFLAAAAPARVIPLYFGRKMNHNSSIFLPN